VQLHRRIAEGVVRQAKLVAGRRLAAVDVEEQLVDAQHGPNFVLVGKAEIEFELAALAVEVKGLARR
jgi:hypothetical protein